VHAAPGPAQGGPRGGRAGAGLRGLARGRALLPRLRGLPGAGLHGPGVVAARAVLPARDRLPGAGAARGGAAAAEVVQPVRAGRPSRPRRLRRRGRVRPLVPRRRSRHAAGHGEPARAGAAGRGGDQVGHVHPCPGQGPGRLAAVVGAVRRQRLPRPGLPGQPGHRRLRPHGPQRRHRDARRAPARLPGAVGHPGGRLSGVRALLRRVRAPQQPLRPHRRLPGLAARPDVGLHRRPAPLPAGRKQPRPLLPGTTRRGFPERVPGGPRPRRWPRPGAAHRGTRARLRRGPAAPRGQRPARAGSVPPRWQAVCRLRPDAPRIAELRPQDHALGAGRWTPAMPTGSAWTGGSSSRCRTAAG
jgi:hypothetical protein